MWCAHCQADVATEISADGQSLKCTTCGHEIRRVFAPSLHPETQSARELLERWAREEQDEDSETKPAATAADIEASLTAPVEPVAPQVDPAPVEPAAPVDSVPERPAIRHQLPFKRAEDLEAGFDSASVDSGASGVRRGQAPKPFRPPVQLRIDSAHGGGPVMPAPRAPFSAGQKKSDQATPTTPDSQSNAPVAKLPEELTKPTVSGTPRQSKFIMPPVEEAQDAPAEQPVAAAGNGNAAKPPTDKVAEGAGRSQPKRRLDAAHSLDVVPAPHLDIAPFTPPPRGARPGRSEALWGQLLAYAGVGVLTVGTVLVLWGYFGSIESYASTGWLLSSAGQMLLFLGVVTLVSGGMQQTTHEVGTRIETLDGRIHRIEQSTHQLLKGPHFARKKRRSRKEVGQSGASDAKSA